MDDDMGIDETCAHVALIIKDSFVVGYTRPRERLDTYRLVWSFRDGCWWRRLVGDGSAVASQDQGGDADAGEDENEGCGEGPGSATPRWL
jgi:hypothetical protein